MFSNMDQKKINNISTAFKDNECDREMAKELIKLDGKPEAIDYFRNNCERLSSYGYWFMLSSLYIKQSDFMAANLWRKFFSAKIPNKEISLMKPNEYKAFRNLPNKIKVYRAKVKDESDWLSYTTNFKVAQKFAFKEKVDEISVGIVKKRNVDALFLRRGEDELLILNKPSVKQKSIIKVMHVIGEKYGNKEVEK